MDDDVELRQINVPHARALPFYHRSILEASQAPSSEKGKEGRWPMLIAVGGLAITTTLTCLLLTSSSYAWTFPPVTYRWILINRATIQLTLQLLANALALVQVSTLGILINRATRLRWRSSPVKLRHLRFWHGLCLRMVDWSIPVSLLLVLLGYILLTATPSAIWAGALTPVATVVTSQASTAVPAYRDTSNIKEWPSQINSEGPILRSPKGLFAYAIGNQMQGSLLTSASSATTVDGSARQHPKLDNSGFTYIGRSYGIGASVGLVNDSLTENSHTAAFAFEEVGYDTSVTCIYNASTGFRLFPDDGVALFKAYGPLPNSGKAGPESSVYVGWDSSAIVAIGVSRDWSDPRRMLGIAAGESYKHLDKTQCSADFTPTSFNVSVGVGGRNITVTPTGRIDTSEDPVNLTYTLMRQFELIANDQTNLYVSLVGNSLNSSITDYIIAQNFSTGLSLEEATLPGLENAFQAMIDDMLVAYASAQLMIQRDFVPTGAEVQTDALRVGEDIYIRAIFAVNLAILLLLVTEAIRTKVWGQVPKLDYLQPGALIMASSREADLTRPRDHSGRGSKSGRRSSSISARIVGESKIALDLGDSLLGESGDTSALVDWHTHYG